MPRARRSSAAFTLKLPATSANLGPAFDCAALALRLHLTIAAKAAAQFAVAASGRDAAICEKLENNLILDTYRSVMEASGLPVQPLALRIRNEIPIGKGCGSSAAARLAGVALAVRFGRLRWTSQQVLEEAARREGHADNAAACWLGGIAIASTTGGLSVVQLPVPAWPLLLVLPPQPLATEAARAVLPQQVSRADAVANVQGAMRLAAAFGARRADWLRVALHDRLHEPYRAPLCPLLAPMRALAGRDGILGAVLSGAGPAVLLFLGPRAARRRVTAKVQEALREERLEAELLFTSAAPRGGAQGLMS